VKIDGMTASIEYCGESYSLPTEGAFTIGRDADLVIDDNPFLHRRFLQVSYAQDFWWLSNVGTRLAATLADGAGLFQAWLAPGAQLPLVFTHASVWFTAGPTTYEFDIRMDEAAFTSSSAEPLSTGTGMTTTGRATLTPEQRLLLLGLAEPLLRQGVRGAATVPSSAEVADRLGWSITKFNRKLDGICQKLERLGVRGLHGGPDRLAANRKARLVEYALASRMVKPEDLILLDGSLVTETEEVSLSD
jgi:hypothetical protein